MNIPLTIIIVIALIFLALGVALAAFLSRRLKTRESELVESEERNRAIVETAPNAIIIMSPDGLIWRFNSRAERMFGYAADEAVGQPLRMLMPERFRESHEKGFRRYMETGAAHVIGSTVELAGLHKSGEEFPLELSIGEVRHGESRSFVGILQDITERREAENELREAEERFRSAFDDTIAGMALVSLDGKYLRVNPAFCEILGYSEEELPDSSYTNLTHPDDQEISQEYERRIRNGEIESYQLEKRYVHAEGHPVWVSLGVSLVRDSDNQPSHFITQLQDISDRVEAERESWESEERFRTLSEATFEGIIITSDGQTLESNKAFAEIFGYEQQEVVGKSVFELLAPESHELVRHKIATESEEPYETVGLKKDGTEINLEIRGRSSVYKDQAVRIAAVRDITGRKRREDELRESSSKLATLIESLRAGILVEDDSRRISRVNQEFCDMFSIPAPPQTLTGTDCSGAAEDSKHLFEEPESFVRGVEERIRDKVPVTGEEFTLIDGRTFERDYIPIFVGEEYRGHLWQYRDITRRKEAEQTLAESEARFRTLFDQTAIGVCVADLNRRLIETNEAYQEITGYNAEELVGMSTLDLTHPEDRARDTGVRRTFASDEADNYQREKRYIRKDGEVIWANASSSLVRDEEGEPRFIMGVVEDVTDRKRDEEEIRQLNEELEERVEKRTAALKESEERYRLVMEGSNDGVWDLDLRTNEAYWNDRLFEIVGLSRSEDLPNLEVYMGLIHPEDQQMVQDAFEGHLERDEDFDVEYRLRHSSGEYRICEARGEAQ